MTPPVFPWSPLLVPWSILLYGLLLVPCSTQQETDRRPPLVESRQPTNVSVVEGDSFSLDCHVTNRATEDTILWKHGSQVLQADHVRVRVDPNLDISTDQQGPSYRRTTTTRLRVGRADTNYAGRYLCVLEWNTREQPVQVEYRVSVIIPPTIEAASANVEKKEGEGAELACIAGGSPQPSVHWTYKSSVLEGEDRPILVLRNLSRQDSGTYECHASNGAGYPAVATVTLTVLYAPRVVGLPPELVAIRSHRSVLLFCDVRALPLATVAWYNQRGMLVADKYPASSNSTHHSLSLSSVSESDLGAFTCIARNSLGEQRATVLLSGSPSAVSVSPSSPTSPSSISLQWSTTSFSPVDTSTISYRQVGRLDWVSHLFRHPRPALGAEQMEREWSFTIRNLSPGTQYEVEVSSRNRHGGSQPSPRVRIATHRTGYSDAHTLDSVTERTWGHYFSSCSQTRHLTPWVLVMVLLLTVARGS